MSKQTRKVTTRKPKKRVFRGIVHIQTGNRNTIITVTNIRGDVLCWSSAGTSGFRGKRKGTSFAAKKAGEIVARKAKDFAMQEARILVSGPGRGRETAIRAIFMVGIKLNLIREKTGLPHNGCRAPKKRRV